MISVRHAPPKTPPDDLWKPHAERLAARVSELERALQQQDYQELPVWPKKRSITVILTVHNRQEMAYEALQSIKQAGFSDEEILIIQSGSANMSGHGIRTLRVSGTNNQCWLLAAQACSTSHVIFLHDDDLMAGDLSEILMGRDDWDAAVWDADYVDAGRITGQSSYFRCKPGVYNGKMVSDIAVRLKLTPSTIQACWPTWYVCKVLEKWEREYERPDFHTTQTMVVGNDLLLWLEASQLKRVWSLGSRHSKCRHHGGSTTVVGLSNGTIEGMYEEVRKLHPYRAAKVLQLCHLFGTTNHDRFLANLDQNRPFQPVEFMASRPFPRRTVRTIPNYEKGSMTDPKVRYGAANCVFAEAAKMVRQEGFDALLYLETDCRFKGEGWDEILRQEYLGALGSPRCVGSPVCWGAFTGGHRQSITLIDYAARYQKDSGRMMAFEGATDTGIFSLYPNGAIAYYSLELLQEAYLDSSDRLGIEKYCRTTEPYDLHIGRLIGQRGYDYATNAVGWLRSSYSGCLDHHYTLSDRLSMLDRNEAVCIHQCK